MRFGGEHAGVFSGSKLSTLHVITLAPKFTGPSSGNSLQWRHKGHNGVSNHQPHHCILNRLFRRRSKKTSKLCVTGLCPGNSPHKWPVTRNMFPFHDVIMVVGCLDWASRKVCTNSYAYATPNLAVVTLLRKHAENLLVSYHFSTMKRRR